MFTRRATLSTQSPARRALVWATFILPTVLLLGAVTAFGFEDPSLEERTEIARLLGLAPGMTVADVGAGDGRYSWDLAHRVGPEGQVYATEVSERRLALIESHIDDHGVDNVTAVLGDQENTGLPEGACDAILLRHVYHHFANPEAMRAGMRWALQPGGRLLVIDFEPTGERRPAGADRNAHGLTADELVEEMSGHGWEVVERVQPWNGRVGHYAVVFRPIERAATE